LLILYQIISAKEVLFYLYVKNMPCNISNHTVEQKKLIDVYFIC